ncbi:ABC transporter substrate-binding protein [Phytomonospora endophytica]|uniref:ABC-type glycerol-3-phosphate transport system substrate-binding protein n=2 Tax=Phytomonospora endophytica TaxID=714109 RepID=A0A841FTK7_9ACTN|nr:extracellular solute-binding protein [Phytomonospora endophytica]MBB6037068.1 ABC-type glycerol-3-phosphate transport system substrate-binding protein [Phytomonospora endophytica]
MTYLTRQPDTRKVPPQMKRSLYGRATALVVAAGLAFSLTACGDDEEPQQDGPVTLVVNGLPPETEKVNREKFLADVAEFEAANPDITIDAREGKMVPEEFQAKLAGGQLEDVFYTYFTDPAGLIARHQVADITDYVKDFPALAQIRPELMAVYSDDKGRVYGVPQGNYSTGLVYNRALFEKAGLDPNSPPKTWADVRTAAQKIAALGKDYVGYGEYSKNNTGGWHFTTALYSVGGDLAVNEGGTWKASFNNDLGKQVLQNLKDMRWTDDSMGTRQGLEYADLLRLMGSGKLGMYLGDANMLPTIVQEYKGEYKDYGLGPIPGGTATLAGGDGYMFNAKASPATIRAGLKWLTYAFANPDPARIEFNTKWSSDTGSPVGLPEPQIWAGDAAKALTDARAKYANMPVENFSPFVNAMSTIPLKLEPPNAQALYALLDVPMNKVLTDENADIAALLADAETQANSILAAVK